MINRGATLISRLAVLFAVLFAVTACGGGGGGGGGEFFSGDGSDNPSLSFALYDPQGNSTNVITSSAPGTLKVTVRNGGSNIVVSADTSLGLILPASGTALTDGGGVATFQLEAGPEKGAGTVTATATVNGEAITGTFAFQVGDTGLRMGYFDVDGMFIENEIYIEPGATLSAGGNAQLSVVVLNKDGERVTTAEEVRFSSGCIAANLATINPEIPQTVNGQASTLYTATGCSGSDNITASLVGATAQAFGTINIASPTANAVNFISAEPTLIVLRGTGGGNRDETSDVVFKVVDGTGKALQGIVVNFSLSTQVGGLSLSKASALSDGEGQVTVTVSSGDIATTVRVLATINGGNGNTIATTSDLLTVTTGLPDQNSISLSVGGGFVVEDGMRIDGVTRSLNVRMADKFNNPVVDGTGAVFTTEYGAIVGSCTTVDGGCSVEWSSQEPRFPTLTGTTYVRTINSDPATYSCPSHDENYGPCPDDLSYIRGGRSTVLVHAIGEESFIDRNGNGIMDEDEKDLFQNLPEAFIDNNEDGIYTPEDPSCLASPNGSLRCIAGQEEIFIDFNDNQRYDFNDDPAVYNGLLCPPEGNGVWCSRELVNVRDEQIVILGDTVYTFELVRNGRFVGNSLNGAFQQLFVSDQYNNQPPTGSTITITTDGDCKLLSEGTWTVPNSAGYGAYVVPSVLTGPPDTPSDPPVPGTIKVTVSPIGGVSTFGTYTCTAAAPPVDECSLSPKPPECPDD
jgi:hypothetical protein